MGKGQEIHRLYCTFVLCSELTPIKFLDSSFSVYFQELRQSHYFSVSLSSRCRALYWHVEIYAGEGGQGRLQVTNSGPVM